MDKAKRSAGKRGGRTARASWETQRASASIRSSPRRHQRRSVAGSRADEPRDARVFSPLSGTRGNRRARKKGRGKARRLFLSVFFSPSRFHLSRRNAAAQRRTENRAQHRGPSAGERNGIERERRGEGKVARLTAAESRARLHALSRALFSLADRMRRPPRSVLHCASARRLAPAVGERQSAAAREAERARRGAFSFSLLLVASFTVFPRPALGPPSSCSAFLRAAAPHGCGHREHVCVRHSCACGHGGESGGRERGGKRREAHQLSPRVRARPAAFSFFRFVNVLPLPFSGALLCRVRPLASCCLLCTPAVPSPAARMK